MDSSDDGAVLDFERRALCAAVQRRVSDITISAAIHDAVADANLRFVGYAQAADYALCDIDYSVWQLDHQPWRSGSLRGGCERRAETGQIDVRACHGQKRAVTQPKRAQLVPCCRYAQAAVAHEQTVKN